MSQEHLGSGHDFAEALASYDASLAGHSLGIISGASLSNKSGTGGNILVTIIGIIFGAFTGFGFYRTSNADTGSAVLTHDGLHFFPTSTQKVKEDGVKVKKEVINSHGFIGYDQVDKAVISRSFIFLRHLNLVGKVQDETGRNVGYRLSITLPGDVEAIDTLKSNLEEQGVRARKSRSGRVAAILLLALVASLFFAIFFPRLTNSYRAMDYVAFRREINTPTSTSAGRYQDRTTTFTARISTNVFTIDYGNGHMNFIGATIAGNDRVFLVELDEGMTAPAVGDIANITAIGMGAIATRPQPEQTTADRFFETLGVAFGDPRISGVVAQISNTTVLSGSYYLHMRAVDIEAIVPLVLGDSDTYIADGGNFQITFVDAFFSATGVGQRQTDIIAIFFDYEALTTHRASRPFNRFVVYQGDVELARSDGGIRVSDADGRGFLTTQSVEAGEVFRAMSAVVADNLTDPITIVVYGTGFDVLFMYELAVRTVS